MGKGQERAAFQESKKLILQSQLLVHFDLTLDIVVACDALPYGIGAVLSHSTADVQEKPVGFMLRTLSSAERNYSKRVWRVFLQ